MNCLLRLFTVTLLLRTGLSVSGYRYHTTLDPAGQLTLDWDVSSVSQKVLFRLSASLEQDGHGWFGLGFSDYGEIRNADFVIYWSEDNGRHHFQDCWTDDHGHLYVDKKQDYVLLTSSTQRGKLVLEFQRRYDTCDPHDYTIENGTTHILFFFGDTDLQRGEEVDMADMRVQVTRVQLLKPDIPTPVYPDDMWTFDVTSPAITVPSTDTTYWWYVTTLPHLPTKHHIIKYEGVIQRENEDIVHHMEVFHCDVSPRDVIRSYNGPGMAEGKPPELSTCRNVIGAWAMGAEAFVLPPEAGTAIGGRSYSPYVLLEIHYNNPSMAKGRIDSSGIRFYVTRQLRLHDAGIMELGLEYTNKMAAPPGQTSFPLTGYCISDCTSVGLGHTGIHVFGSQLHTHLTGRKVFTKHVRHGVELPELNRDNHYSPHFQEIRRLPVPVEVLPGDALVTTCDYRTMDRPNATVGGFSIKDEMCVNYIHYYPRTRLEVCKSSIATTSLHMFFKFLHKWHDDDTSPTKGDRDNYNSIMWTPTTAKLLHTLYDMSPIAMQCNRSDGTRFTGDWKSTRKTVIHLPLSRPKSRCKRRHVFFG